MIYTITLNPAIDKILYIKQFEKTVTARTKSVLDTIGGKGTHVSVNLSCMGVKNSALGICHGETGTRLVNMLEEKGVKVNFIRRPHGNTRTNYLVAEDSGDATLITEAGQPLTDDDINDVCGLIRKFAKPGDVLAFSGDASNCEDAGVYGRIAQKVADLDLKICMDTSGKTLKECIKCSPYLIKPNIDELSELLGKKIQPDPHAVKEAIAELDCHSIPLISVSLGANGAVTKYNGKYYFSKPLKITPVNTVGCGDCYLAGLLLSIDKNLPVLDMLKIAQGTGAAGAECELSCGLDAKRANELADIAEITEI